MDFFSKHKLVVKYSIAGLFAGSIDLSLFFIFKKYFDLGYLSSATFAFMTSFTLAFVIQKYWTFGDYSEHDIHGQFFWYLFTVLSSLCFNLLALSLLIELFNINYILAQAIALLMGGIVGFVMNVRNVFCRSKNVGGVLIAAAIFPPEIGGPASHIKRLAKEMTSRGREVFVITYSKNRDRSMDEGLDVIRIPANLPTFLRGAIYLVSLFISAASYQNIFAQDVTATGLLAMIVKKILPHKNFVIRIGGDLLWERKTESGETDLSTVDYYKMGSYKKEFIYKVGKLVMSKADQIIVPADFLKDIYVSYYNIPASKILFLKNPIPSSLDVWKLSSQAHQINLEANLGVELPSDSSHRDRVILFAGRFIKFKNVPLLIRAFFSIYDEIKPAKLILIGDGPERQRYTEIISGNPLGNRVEIISTLSQAELFLKIQESSLCVCPSWTEPNSNFSLECMSYGKPVLMTRSNGLSIKLPEEMVFSYNNQTELEDKLKFLLNDNFDVASIQKLVELEAEKNSWGNALNEYSKIFSNHP